MRTLHGLEALDSPLSHSVLTIGNFDGVHRAHQQILAQAGLFAANTGGPVVVLTFEPHPLNIVAPDHAPPRLTTPEQKLDYLAAAGADITVVAVSEPSLLGMEAERFVEEVVIDRFHPSHIVEGPSFGFGKGRKGTPELLRTIAARHGCDVHIMEPVTLQIDEGETLMVSSSIIRKLVIEGRVRRASLCLGRRYELLGTVVEGDRRGRTLGFPTANLGDVQSLIPGDGVFVGKVRTEGKTYAAAISIGRNATFDGKVRHVEAHLLDFDGDLYGQPIRVEFQRRLRKHTKFDSPEKLIEQLHRDVADVRASGT